MQRFYKTVFLKALMDGHHFLADTLVDVNRVGEEEGTTVDVNSGGRGEGTGLPPKRETAQQRKQLFNDFMSKIVDPGIRILNKWMKGGGKGGGGNLFKTIHYFLQ